MSKSSEFESQITHLSLLSPEENETGVSALLSKFFKFGRNSPAPETDAAQPAPTETTNLNNHNDTTQDDIENADMSTTSQYSEDYSEGRSLQKVLKRISSLVALKTTSGTRYADTEQARYWMPDNVSRECYECGARFSAFRRRHHCRICGQIFCAHCCSHRVPGHVCGCAGGLRVCTYCCRIVLGCLQSVDNGTVLSDDLKALQENLKEKLAKDNLAGLDQGFLLGGGGEIIKDSSSDVASELGLARNVSVQDTFRHLCLSLPLQQHRYRLVRYPSVWRGGDILQWLTEHGNIQTRIQASDLCMYLIREGLMECVTEHEAFTDYALYRPINLPVLSAAENDQPPMTGSTSSYCLNLNLAENSAHLVRGQRNGDNNEELQGDNDNHIPLQSETADDSKSCCESVVAAGAEHLRLLLVQGLARAGLSLLWAPILLPLCQQVANMITPDVNCPEWDIRKCVRVKRVAGGTMQESRAIGGVVFSKNVAHKGMAKNLVSPRLLLLRVSLVYQRVESKLTSLEPIIMQEKEYLKNSCARVLAMEPDVVIVQGSISRIAQDELRNHGKVLVIGVRGPTLQRLSRVTHGDILTSIDARVGTPRLGTCKGFYLLNYESKTLMVFEGYEKDLKGCSIILRGGSMEELAKVKRVTSLVLLAAYNWRLETSLLADMAATLPISSAPLMFIDNSLENSPEKEIIEDMLDDDNKKSSNEDNKLILKEKEIHKNDNIKESKLSIAVVDPLTSDSFFKSILSSKKIESEKVLSSGIAVDDFSDPLRSRQMSIDDDVFLPQDVSYRCNNSTQVFDIHSDTLRNRWSADEVVLSMSPHVRICVPHLESDIGKRCLLRQYFCTPLFPPPPVIAPSTPRLANKFRKQSIKTTSKDLNLLKPHPFIDRALVQGAENAEVRKLLAHYRSIGGQLTCGDFSNKQDFAKVSEANIASDVLKSDTPPDPLDPDHHQRMYLLFYSYSKGSPNVPDFCINPSIVRMDMYGNNDLSLGQFLERHCFAQQYTCPSQTCQIPLMQHVRNFVHGDGCITVTCVAVENSSTLNGSQLLVDDEGKQNVMWWCRCMQCGERGGGGGSSCLRPNSLALSLAKYLELRLNAPRYIRSRSCQHSLHQHYAHYFACGNVTACFRYKKIKSWDICLPPPSVATHYNTRQIRDCLINQVNDLILKGHETFSSFGENEHEKEQTFFKQHTEKIQLDLTSSSLQEQANKAGIVRSLWAISDALVIGEKILQDSMEKYTEKHTKEKFSSKITVENIVDGKVEADDSSHMDVSFSESVNENKSFHSNSLDLENIVSEEDEEKGERRGLRTILSQLLNSSQPAHQNGVVLCGGIVPVVVRANEISSLIAAALASPQYHQQLHQQSAQSKGYCTDDEREIGSSREKLETDGKSKNSKSYEHIDIQLQDGLFCSIYCPKQFLKLRALLLCSLQSNPNITNDFELKINESNTEASNHMSDKENDGEPSKQTLLLERDVINSVEASPIMSSKRISEDKSRKAGKDNQAKLNSNIEIGEIEEAFIRSLSRCVPWAARGGKSGSTFCKTKDDRFILKEMSKLELQLFGEFAPHYFNYIQSCYQNNLPTLLARIVGVYRVGGVEGIGGGVLVIENLWHGRTELTRRFDLKGAQRNRLAEQGSPDVVLLDENLLNLRWESPIFVQSHSAGVLWAAVEQDTSFLTSHRIMDYSLLVGLDEERQELVLGIIDYIRTFTWDKKLEHIVKKGLGSGLPTIVQPEHYKSRFCVAMKKYFLQSPNQWEQLDRGLICDADS